jgi:hypothetical protein
MDNQRTSIGVLLFIVFLILKLTGAISWSWWWVTVPLWGPVALAIGILGTALLLVSVGSWLGGE